VRVRRQEPRRHWHRRKTDRSRWRWMRIWLTVVTCLWILATWSNHSQSEQIQDERAHSIMRSCTEQNDRNKNTKAKIPADAPERDRQVTIALIDALAPVRDCDLLVQQTVNR
jgi:hypothetical protein